MASMWRKWSQMWIVNRSNVLSVNLVLVSLLLVAPVSAKTHIHSSVEVAAVARSVAELPCDVTSNNPNDPVRLVLWYRADSATPIYSVDTRDADFHAAEQWSGDDILGQRATFRADRHPAALILTNVKLRDEGVYRCRVDFRLAQTRNAHVNLTVIVPPRRPSIFTEEGLLAPVPMLSPLSVGQSLSLWCETSGGKPLPQLLWWLDGQVIDDTFATTSENTVRNDLLITKLSRRDLNKTLTCQAFNSNLTQSMSTSVSIDLFLPPLNVKLMGAEKPLSAGKEVALSCLVFGSRPPPRLTWFLDDRLVAEMMAVPVSGSFGGNETKGTVHFTPTRDDSGKRLTCRSKNVNITDDEYQQDFQDSRQLAIHARPNVLLSLGSNLQADNIKEGDDVYFDCRASASPTVTRLEWFHNDKKLWHNISAGIININQSLVLQRVGRHSAGRYRCLAVNREGETESDTLNLDVKYAPFCRPGQHRVYGVARHEEARIVCDLDANPSDALHFRWYFNSSAGILELPTSTWTSDGGRSVARYLPSSDLDFGSILCSASNTIGHQMVPCVYHVIPADKPDPVTNCSVLHQSSESLQITCNEGFSGGLPQNFLLEIFATEDNALLTNISNSQPTFTIRALHPDTQYMVQVTAVNAKGRSDALTVSLLTLRLPETQKNIGSVKSEIDAPRPEPSSSGMAISPLVAIITGALSALFLLAVILVVALRMRFLGGHPRSGSFERSHSTDADRFLTHEAAPSAGSETLLLAKTETSSTPLFNPDIDDRNPDLIPHQNDGELSVPVLQVIDRTVAPMGLTVTELPPHFYSRMPHMIPTEGSATLGRGRTRWRGEPNPFIQQNLQHVCSTLPRLPRPTQINKSNHDHVNETYPSAIMSSKKESSV